MGEHVAEDGVVAVGVLLPQAVHAPRDQPAPAHPFGRVPRDPPGGGVEAVGAVDERQVGPRVRLDHHPAQPGGDAVGQDAGGAVRVGAEGVHEVAGVERPAVQRGHPRTEHRQAVEVQPDRHDRDAPAGRGGGQRHARGAGPERLEAPADVADALGEEADGVALGEGPLDRRERLGVARGVDAGVDAAVDGYRPRPADEGAEHVPLEQGRLGEEPDGPGRRPLDDGGVEDGVGVVGDEEDGALRQRGADPVDSVEDRRPQHREPPEHRAAGIPAVGRPSVRRGHDGRILAAPEPPRGWVADTETRARGGYGRAAANRRRT